MRSTAAAPASDFTGHSILVVEDEMMIRMFVAEFLLDCGHTVFEAGNVAEAKAILADTPVDLVFSDINMPGSENGFALEKWLRLHYPDIKVLLASGYPHGPADTAGLREPMILKPFACPALLSRIEAALCIGNDASPLPALGRCAA